MSKAIFSPSFKKTKITSHHSGLWWATIKSILRPTGVPISMFAVCWDGAGTGTGARAGTRAGARLFVLSRSRWAWARPGAGLWARLGPGGGSGSSLAPWWPPLWGATGRPGAAPGTVAAPGTTLWAGVASGTGATLAVAVGRKNSFLKFILLELCSFTTYGKHVVQSWTDQYYMDRLIPL